MEEDLVDEDEEEEDLMGSVWLPVILENKMEKALKEKILNDPAIKEIDLAQIRQKDIFVRKADMVSLYIIIYNLYILG